MATGAPAKRTAADWAGCVFFCAFAITLPLTAGKTGLLLLPAMVYEILVAATFLVRGQARRTLGGLGPRVAAYGATFLIPAFLWAAARWAPNSLAQSSSPFLQKAGASIWLFGSVLSFWPVWHLRRSFSIEPAARGLTVSGPYTLARHPIYATHILEFSGIWMLHATIPFGVVLAAWFITLNARIDYEERVLGAEYPEYSAYRERVGAFGPRLSRLSSVHS